MTGIIWIRGDTDFPWLSFHAQVSITEGPLLYRATRAKMIPLVVMVDDWRANRLADALAKAAARPNGCLPWLRSFI